MNASYDICTWCLPAYAVLPGGLVKISTISHCGCIIDPMVGATSLYDVTVHWRITSLKWLPHYSFISFAAAEG